MLTKLLNFLKALSLFCATIIGGGMFVLPYVGFKMGFIGIAFYFIILTIFVIATHWFLAKMVIATPENGTVVGYFEKYLGSGAKNFSLFISATRMVGISLIYIIFGGMFLSPLLSPYFGGSLFFYTLLFFAVAAFLIYIRDTYERNYFANVAMLIASFLVLLLFIIKGFPLINFSNLKGLYVDYFGPPYGIIILALWGLSAVPQLKNAVEGDISHYKRVIYSGIIISAVFYLFFTAVILGVSGSATSPDGLTGFINTVGGNVIKIGFIFGVLAILDSFLSIGTSLKAIFRRDAKLSKTISWFFACFLPISLYLIQFRDVVNIMYLVGAFFYTAEGIIVILAYRAFFHSQFKKSPPLSTFLLLLVFFVILLLEFWYFFMR